MRIFKFQKMKHKVSIKQLENGTFFFTVESPLGKFRYVAENIDWLKSELHEAADNNDIGRALAKKVHEWYYGE